MTEDDVRSGRPCKNARTQNDSATQSHSNGSLEESHVIMDPSIDSPGNLSESHQSMDSAVSSPTKPEESSEICALCNCGSEMALILGQLTQYAVSASTLKKVDKMKSDINKTNTDISSSDVSKKDAKERVFYKRRRRKPFYDFDSNLPPDMTTFGTAHMQDFPDILDANQCIWAHHCCAAWSAGVCQTDSYDLENVDRAVGKALLKKCSHCQRYGASVECQVHRCNKLFHYPCCASAGAFQDITSMILLCPDHLDRTEKLADAEASCDGCGKTENLNLQLFCTSCGHHFHSYCVEMTIPITPVVRMGWQCSFCKVCQGCKQPGDEDRMLCCDHCDKGYHTYCLNPPISAVPKSLWKCVSCRKCDDCGSIRPGGGPSCRWHNNFTLCDRCYQQRKKGQCCPVCNRAVRLFGNPDVLQCSKCFKCVHGECDPDGSDADKYICPVCVVGGSEVLSIPYQNTDSVSSFDYDLAASGQKILSIEEAELYSMPASTDYMASINNNEDEKFDLDDMDSKLAYTDEKLSESTVDSPYSSLMSDSYNESLQTSYSGRGKRKEESGQRRFKKSFRGGRRYRKSLSYNASYSGSQMSNDDYAKNHDESPDSISLHKLEVQNTMGADDDDDGGEDGEEGLHSTVVIVSTRDSYTLKQDVCMCCGSFGKGKEGYLIGCVQCGQCFHPFCVNVKVNEVILKRGWRCLDCTVCEGCGRNADEAHLLLCDICDISFHTYCLSPPLEEVPVGGWKCQWCAVCEDCGANEPGYGCNWMANYTQCGPCSSIQYCSICSYAYEANNLVIQCEKCDRWAHSECDGLFSEEDASLACSMTYHCVQCRPKTKHLGIYSNLKSSVISKVTVKRVLHGNNLMSNTLGRKTKTLHNLKARKLSKAALKEQKRAELDALPLIPLDVSANEHGTCTIDLLSLKNRVRMDELTKEKLHLTESGLKSIKSQVIRAPIHRSVRKERLSKKKEESKVNIMSEEITCSVDSSDETRLNAGERLDTPFEADSLLGDNEVLSPDLLSIKQEEGLELDILHADTTAETDELLMEDTNDDPTAGPDPEDMTDPFEFFGVNLLEKHLHMELESLGIPTKRKKLKKERKKERRLKKARLAEAARLGFDLLKGPCVPDPTAVIVERSSVPAESSKSVVTEIQPQMPSKPEDSMSSADGMASIFPAKRDFSKTDDTAIITDTKAPQMQLMDVAVDLPHVAGHEVEQLFAGFHVESAGCTMTTKRQDELPCDRDIVVPMFSHHSAEEMVKLTPSPLLSAKSPLLSSAGSTDAFRTVFGDDVDMLKDKPSAGEKGDASKIDTQKQLRKWELDEKMGENATISPVLYANVMHKNLIHDYKDWPNRARAIGRLWRKLPADQREPFRLRARDNRVKSKDRGKKAVLKELADHTHRAQPSKPIPTATKLSTPVSDTSVPSTKNTREGQPDAHIGKVLFPNILTVPEPQKLSPLLQNLSPSFSISSFSGLTPSSPPRSQFFPTTPTTPSSSESLSTKGETPGKMVKKTKPKVSKQEKEDGKTHKKIQNMMLQEKEKQWKLYQQHRIFEQQRQAILKQSKALSLDQHQPIHPSTRFNATMTSTLSEDSLQFVLSQKSVQSAFATGRISTPPLSGRLTPSTPTASNDEGDKIKPFSPETIGRKPTPPVSISHSVSGMVKDNPTSPFPPYPKDIKPDMPMRNPALEFEAELRRVNMESLLSRPMDHNSPLRNAEQQQALLLHQQYMATQQQYIQWQLAQQQSSAMESLYGAQKSNSDKELPDVDSEEQHQERIRFLYHQRQFHKDASVYMQQQSQQTQAKQPPTSEVTTSPPQLGDSPIPPGFPRPPHYPPANTPDTMYQQMFMEYMMRYRKAQEMEQLTPQSSQLYNNMMAEIAKQYYQRHGSFGKLFPPPVPPTGTFPFLPRPPHSPYDERSFPPYGKSTPSADTGNELKIGGAATFSPVVLNKQTPTDANLSFMKSHMSPSSTLPKSASFQISRIAADSTSNDEYPADSSKRSDGGVNRAKKTENNSENEISSSKLSTSQESPTIDHSNRVCSDGKNGGTDDEEVSSASSKVVCSDGIHCGTDDEDESSANNRKQVCSDGIHCGTDDEDESSANNRKQVCSDGIHCGTDDEDESSANNRKQVCSDGIHCGTDDEDETSANNRKEVCSDGIHCGTDDEDESFASNRKQVCSDGIHCGTDDEDETSASNRKQVCSDGIHCGTDDEDETSASNRKQVCSDGIHCGTDDEDESSASNRKQVCSDGIHCGTDDEDETSTNNRKQVCSDGIHCGTDDEDETSASNRKQVCSDGIHCGTDDEDETSASNRKQVCSDGIHCGTDDEDESLASNRKQVCSDGIHCGTDDEDETSTNNRKQVCSDGIHCGTDDEDETSSENHKPACPGEIHREADDEEDLSKVKSSMDLTEKITNKINTERHGAEMMMQAPSDWKSPNNYLDNKPRVEDGVQTSIVSKILSPSAVSASSVSPFSLLGGNKDGITKNITTDSSKFGFSPSFQGFSTMENQLNVKKAGETSADGNWPFPNLHGTLNADAKKTEGNQENSSGMRSVANPSYDSLKPTGPVLPAGSSGAVPTSPFSPNSSLLQKGNVISLHPSSPRYHQIFICQHQLLIMQFQQYQFQLQLQFQQLSQQQMSPQQQFLLQQQFHQQMMLLQQQFMQQQAQLHRMAANGIQFTEHQLNAMYQQQILTQQAYRQWVMALPPEQQIHLQQRMQANMQQVQHQMAQIMQHARLEEEQKKKPAPKQRRMNKKKSLATTVDKDSLPPKFPVPELSDEMKSHAQRTARSSVTTGSPLTTPIETNATPKPTVINNEERPIQPPSMPTNLPPNMLTNIPTNVPPNIPTNLPPNRPTNILFNTPTSIPHNMRTTIVPNRPTIIPPKRPINVPASHQHPLQGKKTEVIASSPIFPKNKGKADDKPSATTNILYDENLIRKQQKDFELAQNEMKVMSAHQKAEQLLKPRMATPQQMFFPTHPSQLLHRAKFDGSAVKSPLLEKPSRVDGGPINHQPHVTLPLGETPSFAARNSLNQMAAEVMRRKSVSQPFLPDHMLSAVSTGVISKEATLNSFVTHSHTPFSVSNLLSKDKSSISSANIPHPPPEMMYQPLHQQQHSTDGEEASKFLGTPEEQIAEMEARKALTKPPKKKDKVLEEKKRLKEIERQKKREEKERIKLLKEQRKAEKIQARVLKQKALQEAKAITVKKKQKITSLPIPDAPPENPSSPLKTFTPKSPPMPVAPKIPLCEPEVHLIYPLVQPFGCNSSNSSSKISGTFGNGLVAGVADTYSDRPITPSPLDTSNLQSTTDSNMLHPLFPSPERTYKEDDAEVSQTNDVADSTATKPTNETVGVNEELLRNENGEEISVYIMENETTNLTPVAHCNQCYRPLSQAVYYVDKKLEEVTEGVYDKFELYLSDQLAFCSNECIDLFQSKVKFDVDDEDIELVDAVKTASMVSLDEAQQFSPLPLDDVRGDTFAPGMDPTKLDKPEQSENRRWKRWLFQSNTTKKGRPKLDRDDLLELMLKFDVRLKPSGSIKDKRSCIFCRLYGDGEANQTSRLLNFNVDKWVHLNCALWSSEVYEALNGGLHNVDKAYTRAQCTRCAHCNRIGATVNCSQTFGAQQRLHCEKTFHFPCAVQSQCGFYKDKTILCNHHKAVGLPGEELRIFSVHRKVYIERDVTKQLARMLSLNNDLERKEYTFRVGNLIFHELGHIPTNLLENFSSKEYVYPINFETTSIFWDNDKTYTRRYYTCSISERFRSPRFKVKSHPNGTEGTQHTSCTAKGAWEEIVSSIKKQRECNGLLKVFPEFICGEDLFGLSEPAIQRMIESLPGIDTIPSYNFRFGRTPILIAELPLALNPTGCVRTEKFRKHHLNRPLAIRTATDLSHKPSEAVVNDDNWLSYSQRTAHILSTKTGQYRRMRQDWRNCVVLGRSRIQGLGLFVKKGVEENTFIIEYIGSLIRNEVANRLEKTYERQNRGIYMFRIDNDVVVDATMTGGPARYINHSCDPNCVAEIVSIEGKKRIIIISNRKIEKGEELTYDYKFELEDDSSKIACLCGASNCRKWMN